MDLIAEEGIRALALACPHSAAAPTNVGAAGAHATPYGLGCAGTVSGNVGMALHHKLCHTLGGTFQTCRMTEVHTVVLPQAIASMPSRCHSAHGHIERRAGTSAEPRQQRPCSTCAAGQTVHQLRFAILEG